ncbi:MAG: hypothetical protein WCK35_11780 [Chloroflexota bacterium]
MTTPTPVDQITSEINSLQSRLGWMQESVRLKNTLNSVEDLQTSIIGMPQRIVKIRSNGYVFEKELEKEANGFPGQWAIINQPLQNQINQQMKTLSTAMRTLELKMTQLQAVRLNPGAARPIILSIQFEMDALEDKIKAAENTLNGMYDAFDHVVSNFKQHLDNIEYMLTQLAEAKFTLLPTEGGLRAVKSIWYKNVKEQSDDPEGVLFLTDQRILFEQKEEIVTKKFLFITTAKQKVQELKWEIPVILIDEVQPTKQGMLKNEDHLNIRYKEGASLESTHLHIWQDCNEWMQLLNRAKIKDFDKDRAITIDQAEIAKVKALPSKCPSCGASMDQVVLRGQESINCEYCGFLIRL